MKHLSQLMGMIALLLAFPLAAIAQSGTQTVDFGDGYEITVPADWEQDTSDDSIFVFYGETLSLGVETPVMLEALGWDNPGDFVDVVDALVNLANTADGSLLTRNDTRKAQFDGRNAATYAGPVDDTTDGLQIALKMTDGTIGYLVFLGTAADLEAAQDQIDAIAASFDVVNAEPAANTRAASGGTCTVRADSANSGQLRVGPGENRSAIAFLPANTDVTVTGRTELDDGSIWFQLDKAEAAPQGTAASELWVSAENVDATGACDTVGETNAPPVIPISAPQPTAAPGQSQQPPAQAGALPAPGVWTLSLAPITNASCLGYENVPFSTSEVYTQPTFNGTIVIVNGGSFTFDGNLFRRNGSSNSFSGPIEIPYEDGGSVTTQFRFDLISANSMSGQMVANYNADDGTPCSDTVTFTASR